MSSFEDQSPEFFSRLAKREQLFENICDLEDHNEIFIIDNITVFTKIGILQVDDDYMFKIIAKMILRKDVPLDNGDLCESQTDGGTEWWKIIKTKNHKHTNCSILFVDKSRLDFWTELFVKNKVRFGTIFDKKKIQTFVFSDVDVVIVDETFVNIFFAHFCYCFQRVFFDETDLQKGDQVVAYKMPQIKTHFIWVITKKDVNLFQRKSWMKMLPIEQKHNERISFSLN